jgi:hypothetical protein
LLFAVSRHELVEMAELAEELEAGIDLAASE